MSTREIISIGTTANDGTGDTPRQAGQKINSNFEQIWFYLGGDSNVLGSSISFDSNAVLFTGTTNVTSLGFTDPSADRSILLPDADGTVVLTTATQTLTNKTLTTATLTTPHITGGSFEYIVSGGSLAANRTISLPVLTSNDTFVFLGASQTLTNKTLTSPVLNTPRVGTSIDDVNGAELLAVTATASSVNYLTFANAATGNNPTFTATGTDSDIGVSLNAKSGGSVSVSKLAYTMATITADGAVPKTSSFLDLNKGTALALTLHNGTKAGEVKIFANRGAGTATITPTNFANGTAFAITQNEAAEVIWNGINWFLKSNQSVVTIS